MSCAMHSVFLADGYNTLTEAVRAGLENPHAAHSEALYACKRLQKPYKHILADENTSAYIKHNCTDACLSAM